MNLACANQPGLFTALTWRSLSEVEPDAGQDVVWRIRLGSPETAATYWPLPSPRWVHHGGVIEPARPHHQWARQQHWEPTP